MSTTPLGEVINLVKQMVNGMYITVQHVYMINVHLAFGADDGVQTLGRKHGLTVDYVTWEDCARNKGSCWGYVYTFTENILYINRCEILQIQRFLYTLR